MSTTLEAPKVDGIVANAPGEGTGISVTLTSPSITSTNEMENLVAPAGKLLASPKGEVQD